MTTTAPTPHSAPALQRSQTALAYCDVSLRSPATRSAHAAVKVLAMMGVPYTSNLRQSTPGDSSHEPTDPPDHS
ncbi:MAG: hypothetical protein ACYTFI_20180, partial [Planctomycetota bacterium]